MDHQTVTPRDWPTLARRTHPHPVHAWDSNPLTTAILDILPTSRRGLDAFSIAYRTGTDLTAVRDCLAWLVHHNQVRTRGGYDRHPYEYLRIIHPEPPDRQTTLDLGERR